jgi:ABC-type sugar transport system ATPase subunit
VALTLHRGEILGVAGLVGSGRTELLRALAGTESGARGRLFVDGGEVGWPHTVRRALALGIALAPEDRKGQGLVLGQPAAVNVTMTDMRAIAATSVVSRRRQLDRAREAVEPLAFDPGRLGQTAGTFSGGNQQKLVVGKWLHRRPRILLLDEPTRGIDVGAKAEMFSVMRTLADDGISIIMVSSELEEVVAAADRVLVLARGRSIATLERWEASVERILNLVFRIEAAA